MQNPSERIRELSYENKPSDKNEATPWDYIVGIMAYMDESHASPTCPKCGPFDPDFSGFAIETPIREKINHMNHPSVRAAKLALDEAVERALFGKESPTPDKIDLHMGLEGNVVKVGTYYPKTIEAPTHTVGGHLEFGEEAPKEESCGICGEKTVYVRGRYPGNDNRKVCPTCLQERLDQIEIIANKYYGESNEARGE